MDDVTLPSERVHPAQPVINPGVIKALSMAYDLNDEAAARRLRNKLRTEVDELIPTAERYVRTLKEGSPARAFGERTLAEARELRAATCELPLEEGLRLLARAVDSLSRYERAGRRLPKARR